jgi:hypothetical protein
MTLIIENGALTLEINEALVAPIATTTTVREVLAIANNNQTVFSLTTTPTKPHLSLLYLNGIKAKHGIDYVLNGNLLNWISAIALETTDDLEILYS